MDLFGLPDVGYLSSSCAEDSQGEPPYPSDVYLGVTVVGREILQPLLLAGGPQAAAELDQVGGGKGDSVVGYVGLPFVGHPEEAGPHGGGVELVDKAQPVLVCQLDAHQFVSVELAPSDLQENRGRAVIRC